MNTPDLRRFTASDGCVIHFRCWPAEQCRGVVLAVHGIQSHSGWYQWSSQLLAASGFSVYFADRRGSGLNGLQRGHAAHGERLINDVRALRQLALTENRASVPVTLLGLSWGGKIAAAAACLFPAEFQKLALLYPGLVPRLRFTWSQRAKLKLARNLEIVKRHIPIPLDDPALFTQVPQWQQFIREDPLALHTVTSGLLNSGIDLDRIVAKSLRSLQMPTLLMLAGDDQIIDNQATLQMFSDQSPNLLQIRTWSAARHTLEFEPQREQIFQYLTEWLEQS
ncbi:MAG: alpha/beta hydrolase [Planctomycetaceae bacterium]